MYKIVFTSNGEIVQQHKGFTSFSEAYQAVRDMDMMIPFTWSWEIEEE